MALLSERRAIIGLLLGAAAIALCNPAATTPDVEADQEHVVKAAFIYNFAKFIEWPASAFLSGDAPYVIGIVGPDPFGPAIDRAVQGKNVAGRPFQVKRLRWDGDLRSCQILFIAASERARSGQIVTAVKGAPVLTISDSPGFAARGVVLSFFLDEGRVRFEINPDAAKRARLAVSSKILSLAKVVTDAK